MSRQTDEASCHVTSCPRHGELKGGLWPVAREELSIAHTRVSALGSQSLPRRLEVAAALTFETVDL